MTCSIPTGTIRIVGVWKVYQARSVHPIYHRFEALIPHWIHRALNPVCPDFGLQAVVGDPLDKIRMNCVFSALMRASAREPNLRSENPTSLVVPIHDTVRFFVPLHGFEVVVSTLMLYIGCAVYLLLPPHRGK